MDKQPLLHAPDSGHYEVASDEGAENWVMLASLIETGKLHAINPKAYFADGLAKLVKKSNEPIASSRYHPPRAAPGW
jgi:hypothetical protein